ncbi:alpha-L-fucosidase [Bifidobacterium sp. 82T10]|uniref:Alpha-L-fucosidase n=1 Tax=Bifidobacterium miconis TaxID=2834435 RepID=A0ABS6WDA1_9BIFI|nr:alpha-L-fucosidase [Bifidobacterium miconis]MBW3091922.1 alpha-L-fucosidase [Bifidobacterium miconis]
MAEHIMQGAELASKMKASSLLVEPRDDERDLELSANDITWWHDAKIGMFVHWGVYSVIGKGEWAYFNEHYAPEEYRRIAREEFHPALEPDEIAQGWMDVAQSMGARYTVMVTRHHDGYAMWDSKASWQDFTSVDCGPGKDYVAAYAKASRDAGMGLGLYYSPMDWRFPGYFDPAGQPESAQAMKRQAWGQIRELCSQYQPDILWYDGGWLAHQGGDRDQVDFWDAVNIARMVRSFNPKTLMTPRSGYRGDFACDEGPDAARGPILPNPWEKCFSSTAAWGYIPGSRVMEPAEIVRLIVDSVTRGGNVLINVGPDADGRIPEAVKNSLSQVGQWLERNGQAVYGTQAGPWQPVDGVYGSVTAKDGTIYLHVLDRAAVNATILPPVGRIVRGASLFDGTPVACEQDDRGIRLALPDAAPDDLGDIVVRLYA